MSQQRGLPSPSEHSQSSSTYSSPDNVAGTAFDCRWDWRPSQTSISTPPSQNSVDDQPTSPTSGRLINIPSFSSVGVLPHPGHRSPLRPIPSPLSRVNSAAVSPTSANSSDVISPSSLGFRPFGPKSSKLSVGDITFYSDSSSPSTPEEENSRFVFPDQPNDKRSDLKAVGSKADPGSSKAVTPNMAATMAPNLTEATVGLPRNSSIDASISSISSKSGLSGKADTPYVPTATDIAILIATAGSPEAVIQHLLKDKQSQSQQNSQLWRLVDKQRAMILGLNKDLEGALKEKEKYRRKLKDVMSSLAAIRGASNVQKETHKSTPRSDTKSQRSEVPQSPTQVASQTPDTLSVEADSPKHSPVDISIAPYPITPPADKPHLSPNAVSELLDPTRAMPKPREHALDHFDHEADEKAVEDMAKDETEQQMKEIPYSVSVPPSRSLPSNPPSAPPPSLPPSVPALGVVRASPQPENENAQFQSPLRKGPPAPLKLDQLGESSSIISADEFDSDTDLDHILEVDEIVDESRGRSTKRDDDDAKRPDIVPGQNQAHHESETDTGAANLLAVEPLNVTQSIPRDAGLKKTTSVDALRLAGNSNHQIASPLLSPGLPSSPRPLGALSQSSSGPLSARLAPAASLSPRPPRQPITLPSKIPSLTATPTNLRSPYTAPLNVVKRIPVEAGQRSPTERTAIYQGLVTDEYPELLLAPNALFSIEIKVASSRMKPSRASLLSLTQLEEDPVFTLAILSRADHSELWRVEKDIASLCKLDSRLKQCAAFTAKTPERSLFNGHAPAKLDARRAALEHYLEELLDTPLDTVTAVELCTYLSTNTLPPNADETGSSFRPTPENSGLKSGADDPPLRSGYLTKKGKNFGGWKARFFVLDGPQLKYYETPGGAHLGTIKLRNAQIGKQSQSQSQSQTQNSGQQSPAQPGTCEELDNQYRHAFLILEPKKKDSNALVKHVLCAESDRERDLWVDVLLQWIDSRDPDEPEPPHSAKASHDRQFSGPDDASTSRPKKSGGSNKSQNHQHGDSETLIGVRYDSTHAGEAPQKGSAPLAADLPNPQSLVNDTMSSQANKLLSGPKDGHLGNRLVPSQEEKKQRKRSFFGFGPKTRSSSDGQDSLFGGSDGGSTGGPGHYNGHQGPVRQVFGASLAEAVRYNPPVDVDVPLPSVVYRCIEYLDHKNAVIEEGIFRLSGSNVVIKQLRERFNTESDVNLVTDDQYYDIHAVASLLKLYLRELPTTILTRDLHLEFLATTEMPDRKEKIAKLSELAGRLPRANVTLLKYLIAFLISIINNSDVNKMNVRNVGIVFSPTLNIPAQVFAMFLQNYEGIFGIAPEEYELPFPAVESRSHAKPVEAPVKRAEVTRRPSTSSSSASPHRQPRKDVVKDYQRSTPTPPLMSTLQSSISSRSTPTPPISSRPAYESGYLYPTGHESQSYQPVLQRAVPAYDRPIFPSASDDRGSDVQSSTRGKRRESAMFMGGFMNQQQQQESMSRLRQEPPPY